MINSKIQFPKIDFHYWSNKNDYFSNNELLETIKIGLDHARKGGLIGPILDSITLKSNRTLVNLIESKIQLHDDVNKFSDDDLLIIFDLIQGWGGKMGKTPYVKPQNGPTRLTWKPLAQTYRESIGICFKGNFEYLQFLNGLLAIPGIGESFATKHMFFWTEYGPRRQAIPIYDARIKLLLCLHDRKAVDYQTFYASMKKMANETQITVGLLERALFAFSQNYFPNKNLLIKQNVSDTADIDEAQFLQKRYVEFNSLN